MAGLTEGEGCFGSYALGREQRYYPSLTVEMTDIDIVERVGQLWQKPVRLQKKYNTGFNKKPCWRVALVGTKAAGWMMVLYQFMGIRRKAAIRKALSEWGTKRG